MKITIQNYESFVSDYLEGLLNPSEAQKFEKFLSEHPDFFDKILSENVPKLELEPVIFPFKQSLKKFDFETTLITELNFSDFCIAFHEGILSNYKQKELLQFIENNPAFKSDFNLFQKTKLLPPKNLIYREKDQLYHHKFFPIRSAFYKTVSIAAGLAIIVTIYIKVNEVNTTQNVVVNNQNKTKAKAKMVSFPIEPEKKPDINKRKRKTIYFSEAIKNEPKLDSFEVKIDSFKINTIKPLFAQLTKEEIRPVLMAKTGSLPSTKDAVTTGTNLTEYALNRFKKDLGIEKVEDRKGKISFFKILQAGIKGFNEITESNIQLTEKTDSEGNLTAMTFKTESGKFQIHHKKYK